MLVHLENEDPFEVTLEALELSGLGAGDTLDSKARKSLLDTDRDVRVREAALNLLAYRARTRRELRTRLRRKGFEASRIDVCLERLEQRGLLDDGAVAAAFVRDCLRHRPRGRPRLLSELRAKGIDSDTAQETVDRVYRDEDVTDGALARAAAEGWLTRQPARVAQLLADSERSAEREKERRRLYGYLARRGFRGDALSEALEHAASVAQNPDTR